MINVNGKTVEWTCWHCGLGSIWDTKYPGLYRRPRTTVNEKGELFVICPFCGRCSKEDPELFDTGVIEEEEK